MSGPEKLPPLPPFCSGPFTVNRATNWIEGVDAFGGPCHMLDVRGWGYLTGRGTALRLPDEVAIKAQRETAQWVVDAMNAAWNRRTPDPAQIRADALRELCDDLLHLGDDLTYFPALAEHNLHIKAYDIGSRLFSLIATPLSPPAVDNSPAPDAGGKEGV